MIAVETSFYRFESGKNIFRKKIFFNIPPSKIERKLEIFSNIFTFPRQDPRAPPPPLHEEAGLR